MEGAQRVPVTLHLKQKLRALLEEQFPRSTPLSLLLLHLAQWEPRPLTGGMPTARERQRYHAPAGLLEQVLVNVRRAIRTTDMLITHEGACTAIIFPGVDELGLQKILERVNRNIDLLQAETMIPPLTRETEILIGAGSYTESELVLEKLLTQTGRVARGVVLHPAIASEAWSKGITLEADALYRPEETRILHDVSVKASPAAARNSTRFPFMQLPKELPTRLKQLIPYHVARDLHCAPVGRDHHHLTVAMMDPLNAENVRYLEEMTGMSIFPVTCEAEALDALLARKW